MKNKTIKTFLIIVSFLAATEVFFVVTHFIIVDKYQRIADNLVSEYQLTKKTTDLVNSFYDLIQYSNDQQRVLAFRNNLDDLHALLAKLDRSLAKSSSWSVYLGAKNSIGVVITEVNKGVDDNLAGNFAQVTADYLKAANDNTYVRENVGSLLLKELENVETMQIDIANTKFWSSLIGSILFLATILGSLLYLFISQKKSAAPKMAPMASLSKNGSDQKPPPNSGPNPSVS